MKSAMLMVASLCFFGALGAQEIQESEEFEMEEPVAAPRERIVYARCYYMPHRYCDFYRYPVRDHDATWPGKKENSFMEALMR